MSSNKPATFVPKFKRKKAKRDKDEFFVNNKKDITIVKKYKDKIERMYPVQIQFDAKCEGGQWILVFGEHVDKRNAKYYIQAICNPGERKVVEFPQSALKELTDPEALEYIEAKTNAFIRPLEKIAEFEISGTELAVTLALSEIEELAGSAVKERSGEVTEEQTEDGVIKISPAKGNTKKRLSDQLQRALSNHSDGICSFDDYKETSPAVQRVLVNCLEDEDNDIDDDDLFSDGKDGGKDFSETFHVKIYDDEPDSSERFETCDGYDIKPTTDVLEISQKLGCTSLSKSQKSETPDTAKADQALNNQQEYLRSFGLKLGFNDEDVNHALDMIDEKTRPSDFFDLLNIVKQQTGYDSTVADNKKHELDTSDDVIIEGETIEYFTKEKSTEEVSNTNQGASAADSSKNEQTTLPETYKERLMMDFFQEDDTCDIEELKRRNAERQKLLKQNFEKQGQAENQPESKGKKKRRGKQKKNQQQISSGECAPMAVLENRENRTFSNDMEQTCRLRIWSDDDSGIITGENNASELDEFRTPFNRKNRSQSAGNQQQEQLMSQQYGKGRGQNPQGWHSSQNTPNKPTQRGISYSEVAQGNKTYGSPGRAQFGSPGKGQRQYQKPMQVVNPVHVEGQARVEAPQGVVKPAELRYIVIDGSNVAMTHGNGKEFSCKGIQVCVDYFKQRGHQKITVFVPNWRNCRPGPENVIVDQHILQELKEDGSMVFTPSRRIGKRLVAAYDDRFVVELAEAEDAIIVSNDQYRDLMTEKATWKTIIETRLLMYSFVRDRFMPPNDPLGRDGPCLDKFLTVTQDTPRYFHGFYQPRQNYKQYNQRGNYNQQGQGQNQGQGHYTKGGNYGQDYGPSYRQQYQGQRLQQQQVDNNQEEADGPLEASQHQTRSPFKGHGQSVRRELRTDKETDKLQKDLTALFPEESQEMTIKKVLSNHARETNLERLANYCMSVLDETLS